MQRKTPMLPEPRPFDHRAWSGIAIAAVGVVLTVALLSLSEPQPLSRAAPTAAVRPTLAPVPTAAPTAALFPATPGIVPCAMP